jgi:medium-chain acyl-[acyl-carrier-protein] hydrolase
MSARSPWLVCTQRRPRARLRLFCFPYAGGGAAAYRDWADLLPDTIELVAVQPPGRESRYAEPPLMRVDDLVGALADAITGPLDLPYATFGHSLGTLVSYELALELARRGLPLPQHLVMSGRAPPHVEREPRRLHLAPDPEFIAELRRLQGTPDEVLANPELMQVVLPALRADFALAAEPRLRAPRVLPVPLSVFGGLADAGASRAALLEWQACSAAPIALKMFPGGHFFIHGARYLVVQTLVRTLYGFLEEARLHA